MPFTSKLVFATLLVSLGECANISECRLDNLDALGRWIAHKNNSHISPILPETGEQLRWVGLEELKDQPQLNSRPNCTPDDSETAPTHSRALCRWHYRVNYDPKRLPSSIAEAVCHCPKVTPGLTNGEVGCVPLAYRMRVLKFDQACKAFVEAFESIQLACIPVIQVTAKADNAEVGVVVETFQNEY